MTMQWIQSPARPGDAGKRYVTAEKAAVLAVAGWTETTAPTGVVVPGPTVVSSPEDVRDIVGALLQAGTNVQIVVDDAGDTITISATGGGSVYLSENARDDIAAALRGAGGATIEVDDAGDTITIRSKNKLAELTDLDQTGAAAGSLSALRRKLDGSGYLMEPLGSDGASADPTRWMFSAQNLQPGIEALTVGSSQVYATGHVETRTPSFPCSKMKFAFPGWYVKRDGTANPETDMSAPLPIRAAYSLDGGSTWTAMAFGGQAEGTVPVGGVLWCDDITFGTPQIGQRIIVRTYRAAQVGATVPGTYKYSALYVDAQSAAEVQGCYYTATQADALALLSGGTITNNGTGTAAYYYGPCSAVATGWDGRPVGLVVGDSVGYGPQRAGRSWLCRGLDDTKTGGRRIPHQSFCVHGTRASDGSAITAGQYRRRDELVQSVATMNGGKMPMTFVLSEMGVNDSGVTDLNATMTTWWAFLVARFGVPVVQTSLTPRSTSATQKWSTTEGQTPNDDQRWVLNAQLPNHVKAGRIAGWVDISPATQGDDGRTKVWKVPAWHSFVAASAASGATTIQLNDPPPLGAFLACDPGLGTVETIGPVNSYTGTGPYTCALNTPTGQAHAAGALVQAVMGDDGIHPEKPVTDDMADCIVRAKQAGVFGRITGYNAVAHTPAVGATAWGE